jgi:hypothetical protein
MKKVIIASTVCLLLGIFVAVLIRNTKNMRLSDNGAAVRVKQERNRQSPEKPLPRVATTEVERNPSTVIKPKHVRSANGTDEGIEIEHDLEVVDLLNSEKYPTAVYEAQNVGALGAVSFQIVDDQKDPVADVTIRGGFWNNGKTGHDVDCKTDENGFVSLRDICTGDLNLTAQKDGFYQTKTLASHSGTFSPYP